MPQPTSPATVMLLALLSACGSTSPQAPAQGGFRVIDATELQALASQSDGRPRVVNFWATWCGPCVAEMPELKHFATEHPEVEVVLVNLDFPTLTTSHVRPFIRRHELHTLSVVQLGDPDPATAVAGAVEGWPHAIPFTLVLDDKGARSASFARQISKTDLEDAVGLR